MKKKVVILASYVLVAALSAAAAFGLSAGQMRTGKLQQLQALIEEKFIGDADSTALEDAAADAMVKATGDRWSYYISAEDYEAYTENMNNAYQGVGITITVEDGGMRIVEVYAGSGAAEAGLEPQDLLIAVEDTDVRGMETGDVRDLIRGAENTFVTLTVLRNGEELRFQVERRQVEIPVVFSQMITETVGYVAIDNFDTRCAQEAIAAIEDLLGQGARKLLFDVRYNPGGYADELVELLDYLLPEGDLFRTIRYDGQAHVDTSDANCLDMPMAVLINADSYSAAEFFAAALQEYEAATVVGEKSVGKGYFQNTFRLSDGSAVALSVGKYFTPKGVSLAEVGVTPDVECPVDEDTAAMIYYGTLEPLEDPQILAALEALGEKLPD